MIRFGDFKLTGAPPLLSWVVRQRKDFKRLQETTMKFRLFFFITIGFSVVASTTMMMAANKDSDGFQGVWEVVSAEWDGDELSAEDAKAMTVIFKGDKSVVTIKGKGDKEETFTLDSVKKPKWIDMTPKSVGIYELDGDQLKIRLNRDSSDRPTTFAGPTNKNETLVLLKRRKK